MLCDRIHVVALRHERNKIRVRVYSGYISLGGCMVVWWCSRHGEVRRRLRRC